jgi:hypothetical protein
LNIPTTLRAGDTIEWDETVSDYPAGNNYTLAIDLRSKDKAPITITATANGNDYAISVAPATSATWPAGNYFYQAYVYKSSNNTISEKYTLQNGQIKILPNLTGVDSQADLRSIAEKNLDMIEARLSGDTSPDVMSYSIAGRSLSKRSWDELMSMRAYWKEEVRVEQEAESTAAGTDNPRRVGVRFNRV